jgi:hypothetical protein
MNACQEKEVPGNQCDVPAGCLVPRGKDRLNQSPGQWGFYDKAADTAYPAALGRLRRGNGGRPNLLG